MDIILVSAVALLAAILTLFSGFGLGTLLMPVVAIFFPLEIAIAITAVVHLANNVFKVFLLGRKANMRVLLTFGLPAIVFAFIGAWLLSHMTSLTPLLTYSLGQQTFVVAPINLLIGLLILAFVAVELLPAFAKLSFDKKYLPIGGVLSGFFGGLSGHQGAFRSMFLLKVGLTKQTFIATGVMIAVLVDVTRLAFYGNSMVSQAQNIAWPLIISASISAFLGSYVGAKLVTKITMKTIQSLVALLLVCVALGLISGVI